LLGSSQRSVGAASTSTWRTAESVGRRGLLPGSLRATLHARHASVEGRYYAEPAPLAERLMTHPIPEDASDAGPSKWPKRRSESSPTRSHRTGSRDYSWATRTLIRISLEHDRCRSTRWSNEMPMHS